MTSRAPSPVPPAPESGDLPPLASDLASQVAELAKETDARTVLLVGQRAIARFGPAPALLRHVLGAGRLILEEAEAGALRADMRSRNVGVYVDALLEAAVPLAAASAPLFVEVVLALFVRRRWNRAAALVEAALASGHPSVPEPWLRTSLARARAATDRESVGMRLLGKNP